MKGRGASIRLLRSDDASTPNGGEAALTFDNIYTRFAPYVAAIAYKLTGTNSETEDILQEVFCQCAGKWRALKTWDDVKPWLATVAVRITRRHLQRKRRFRFGSPVTIDSLSSREASPEASAEVRQALNLMSSLTVDQRIAWVLYHAEEEDIDTIATRCGWSRATVKRRLQEARILLSEMTHEIE